MGCFTLNWTQPHSFINIPIIILNIFVMSIYGVQCKYNA